MPGNMLGGNLGHAGDRLWTGYECQAYKCDPVFSAATTYTAIAGRWLWLWRAARNGGRPGPRESAAGGGSAGRRPLRT
jgi:hypothetical protein